jgi:peptidoglycan/xylan/chitin deacetylase (PgdA/CDA1 family)
MTWSQVEEVARHGVEIGSHTVTHPRMTALTPAEIERELSASRAAIEQHTGKPVRSFAYPYGDINAAVCDAVRQRFPTACGTRLAYLSPESDPAELPRIDMYYLQQRFWFEGLRGPRGQRYLELRGLLRRFRQILKGS